MKLYVHYQERAVREDGAPMSTLTDVIIPFSEFEEMYDEPIIEHLLNTVGLYTNNGVVYLNRNGFVVDASYEGYTAGEFELQFRVKYIVTEGNLQDYCERNGLSVEIHS